MMRSELDCSGLFLLDGLRRFRKALDFEPLSGFQEGGQLILGNVDFAWNVYVDSESDMSSSAAFQQPQDPAM